MNKIRVLLVDDHAIVRQGFHSLLEKEKDIEVVGEASSGEEGIELAKQLRPTIVVMDIKMPGINGLEATRQIIQYDKSMKIIILTMFSDKDLINQAITAGASGYLSKETVVNDLLTAIREVGQGNAFFSPRISKELLIDEYHHLKSRNLPLTQREIEIFQLVVHGATSKIIGDKLSLSVRTVEKHREQIMKKLNLHDVASLTKYAIERGIIDDMDGKEPSLRVH